MGIRQIFLHEHPAGASSWHKECIKKIFNKHGVVRVVGDQCRYGLVSPEKGYIGPARERTGFMTNYPCIAAQLDKRCRNTKQHQVHQHVTLQGGRPHAAQVYPPGLCKAICEGIRQQKIVDEKGQFLLAQVGEDKNAGGAELMTAAKDLESKYKTI